MNHFYRFLFVFLMSVSASAILQAQGRPQPPSADTLAARETRILSEKLALSPEQTANLRTVLKGVYQQKEELQVNTKDSIQRKQQVHATHKAHEQAIKKILTLEQWKEYEKGVAERKAAFLQHAKEKRSR